MDSDGDDEQFRYEDHIEQRPQEEEEEEEDKFVYPTASSATVEGPSELKHPSPPAPPAPKTASLSRVEHERIYGATASGDLDLLQRLVQAAVADDKADVFSLVNEPSSRGSLTLLHLAANRGHLDIVQWLVSNCGAIIGSEDGEGETSLHKAALNGYLDILRFLVSKGSSEDVHAQDADGWTALHNACSKGYLDIVRFLCEQDPPNGEGGERWVDKKSKGGWTPLMNAASKGHLPVVNYLLSKQKADPLVRNKWGETAYDIAASVFEIWICQVLAKSESTIWRRRTTALYNPLATHTTVPLVLYENQRLDTRLKTLAMAAGRPKFSPSGLGRKGRVGPFELRMPVYDADSDDKRDVPAWRSDIELPVRNQPFVLPVPRAHAIQGGAERSHFWLSDWTLDLTDPRVDATTGWQYSTSFKDPDENWSADPPLSLERLLNGTGVLTPGPISPGVGGQSTTWVRRRRWVRVMRRRLDIPALPFMESDGSLYSLTNDGSLVPHVDQNPTQNSPSQGDENGAELSSIPLPSPFLSQSQDYVSRAKYLAGGHLTMEDSSNSVGPAQVRRSIAKLERAVSELRVGLLNDIDGDRKTQADVILNTYSRELERQRLYAGSAGITRDDTYDEFSDSDSEEFHYPTASPSLRTHPPSIRSSSADYFGSQAISIPTDLSPHLSQAVEFRVPTHDTPQKAINPGWRLPEAHALDVKWEADADAVECHECKRRFTFILRKHCRKCGLIFCDRCTSYRANLEPSDVVQDPARLAVPSTSTSTSSTLVRDLRVCESCHKKVAATRSEGSQRGRSPGSPTERIEVGRHGLAIHGTRDRSPSQISDFSNCPVCERALSSFSTIAEQEAHVKNCLEGGNASIPSTNRYVNYKLPAGSVKIGSECVICLEEFVKGTSVATLSCLCTFHSHCVAGWLERGRSCPVHAR